MKANILDLRELKISLLSMHDILNEMSLHKHYGHET